MIAAPAGVGTGPQLCTVRMRTQLQGKEKRKFYRTRGWVNIWWVSRCHTSFYPYSSPRNLLWPQLKDRLLGQSDQWLDALWPFYSSAGPV